MTKLTLARSMDGGGTFVNFKINQPPLTCDFKVFFGDYSGISAYNGRVVPIYMHFDEQKKLAVSVALFHFKPGTQERVAEEINPVQTPTLVRNHHPQTVLIP